MKLLFDLLKTRADAFRMALSGSSSSGIRRDAQGVPTAFRILAPGPLSLTLDGQPISGDIAPAHIRSILDWYAAKGELVPVDCEHLLQKLADLKGVSEADLVKTNPLLGESAAAGFVALVEENGELWAKVSKWSARARELLAGTADKVYAYFSPVLRGLKDGPLRITSIALTNCPAISGQEMLAAAGQPQPDLPVATISDDVRASGSSPSSQTERPVNMDTLKKLLGLLGMDVAAFTAEKADLSPLFSAALAEIEKLRGAGSGFLANLKAALALTDADTLDTAAGKILSALEKAKGDASALTAIQARVSDLEGKERDRLIDSLKAEGKLTEAMLPWAKKQDQAALRDWAATAPVVVPQGRTVQAGQASQGDDTLKLTDADRKVAAMCNHTPEEVAAANKMKV